MTRETRIGAIGVAITALAAAGVTVALITSSEASEPTSAEAREETRARPGNVSCGQTLTQSTIVANDLENCGGDGLIVGADGITIDLDGHTIDGRTIPTGTGILISGFDQVVVKNGTITGFEVGVSVVFGAESTEVRDLRISDNRSGNGIDARALRAVVTGNTVFGRAIGILMGGSATTAVSNTAKDNEIGIFAGGSEAVVTGNTALSNAAAGIQVTARDGAIVGNVANANGGDGIDATGGTGTTTVRDSIASFNTLLGIDADGDVRDDGGNSATGNGSLHQCENVVCAAP